MTNDLKARIEGLNKLDRDRTQGDWRHVAGAYVHGDEVIIHSGMLDGVEFYNNHPSQEHRDRLLADAKFIASAPEAYQLCRDLYKELEASEQRERDALARIAELEGVVSEVNESLMHQMGLGQFHLYTIGSLLGKMSRVLPKPPTQEVSDDSAHI